MLHPDSELRYIDPEIGYGVFATQLIPKGTITWVRDAFDLAFTPTQVESLGPIHQSLISKYAYRDHTGDYILCWDFGRYVNHSFRSNCMATGYDFEIAVRDILPGEELTNDYGYLNLSAPFKARDENVERTYVYPDDLLHYHAVWDAMLRPCLPLLFKVYQPLLSLVPHHELQEIRHTIDGKREMKSILTHYYYKEEHSPLS